MNGGAVRGAGGRPGDMAALRAESALRRRLQDCGESVPASLAWQDYDELVAAVEGTFRQRAETRKFPYRHPVSLQDPATGVGKPYTVNLAVFDWSGEGHPVVAIGGITNVSQRFDFLALDSLPEPRVIGLDLAGRGGSGWMAEISDYHMDTYVEQLHQFLVTEGLEGATVLGSSLGGMAAIRLAARHPEIISRLVLNDTGPFIPAERRRRRARAVARHYVFRNPAEMFRRTGAAAKYTGFVPDAVLLHVSHHKTRWSEEEDGRVYRHDLRALLAYRSEASSDLDLWSDWNRLECPVLLVHGMLSDATDDATVERMRRHGPLSVIQVPGTGHTPLLCDRSLALLIAAWIADDRRYPGDILFEPTPWPMPRTR